MNNRTDFSLTRSLALLTALKSTAADFAKREEELTRDLGNRRSVLRRKHRDATARVESRLATETGDAQSFFGAADAGVKASYNSRKERIERLRISLLKNLAKFG